MRYGYPSHRARGERLAQKSRKRTGKNLNSNKINKRSPPHTAGDQRATPGGNVRHIGAPPAQGR